MLTLKHNYLTIYLFKETIIRNCLINEEVGVGGFLLPQKR